MNSPPRRLGKSEVMAKPSRKFQESFRAATEINDILQEDSSLALRQLHDAVTRFKVDQSHENLEAAEFCAKASIRAFLGHVDGIGYALRRVVVKCADEAGLSIPTKRLAELMERKYDSGTDSILQEAKLLSTESSIKLATTWFPKLSGGDFRLDTDGEGWRGFKRLVTIRNAFTHPEQLEDLFPQLAFPAIHPTIIWFLVQMHDMFAACASKLGFPQQAHEVVVLEYPYKESNYPFRPTFSKQDISDVQSVAARTYEYVKLMVMKSSRDVVRALDSAKVGSLPLHSHAYQYAVRNAVRALFAEVEARTGAALFFIEAAKRRGEIQLSEADMRSLSDREVENKFVAALTIFSREFGNDYVPETIGDLWEEFRGASSVRDRLTHPKDLLGLKVDLKIVMTLLKAAKYFLDASEAALALNFVKCTLKAKLFERIIEEENAAHERSGMRYDEPLETFYRVLYTQGHYEQWAHKAFTSSHYMAPGDWERRFQETGGSLDEVDYDRAETHFGEMTERALQMWLELKRRGTDASTEEEKFALGEAPGVFAYRTARQALDNHPCDPDEPMVHFVAFRGRFIGPCPPEKDKGGVVATVEEILCPPLTRAQFKARFA
jgi:hypothetical protein